MVLEPVKYFSRHQGNQRPLDGVSPSAQLTPDVEASKFAANTFSIQCFIWNDSILPSGSGTFACTATTSAAGSNETGQVVIAFTGVEQVTPQPQGRATSTSADTSSSVTVTPTVDGSYVVDCHGRWEVSAPAGNSTPGTGQTEVADFQPMSTFFRVASSYEAIATGGSAESQTWSWVGDTEVWTAFAIVLRPFIASTNIQIETGNYVEGDGGASFSHTLTAAANRVVLVFVDDESETHPTGITYDGVSMTSIEEVTETEGLGNAGSLWAIFDADLPVGAGTFSVVVSGLDAGAGADAVEINGIDQVIPMPAQIDSDTTSAAVLSLTASPTVPLGGESILVGMGANGGAKILSFCVSGVVMIWMIWRAFQKQVTVGDLALFYQAINHAQNLMRSFFSNVGRFYNDSLFLSRFRG